MRITLSVAVLLALAATAAHAEDRYGAAPPPRPQTFAPAGPASTDAQVSPLGGAPQPVRLLTWSGKGAAAPRALPAPAMAAQPAPLPHQLQQPAWRRPIGTPAPQAVARAEPTPTLPQRNPPPASLYDTPPAPQAVRPTAQPAGATAPYTQGGARFYSVHREYGVRPDPIPAPLPAPFFGGGALTDLAEPPPPVERRGQRVTQADGTVITARPGTVGGDWAEKDDPGLAAGELNGGRP